ncbi:MAG: hypothetical protein IKZ34_02400 [Alphaproteobacteria bacterium]|nr:hypothetical protein [Alphaproteobacteria bacterium]
MTDKVKDFNLGIDALRQQGAIDTGFGPANKARGFNKGIEPLNVADIFRTKFGLTFGGNEN